MRNSATKRLPYTYHNCIILCVDPDYLHVPQLQSVRGVIIWLVRFNDAVIVMLSRLCYEYRSWDTRVHKIYEHHG